MHFCAKNRIHTYITVIKPIVCSILYKTAKYCHIKLYIEKISIFCLNTLGIIKSATLCRLVLRMSETIDNCYGNNSVAIKVTRK